MSDTQGQGGFSLIETLVALCILVVGVLGVTRMFSEGRRIFGDVEQRRAAVWLAHDKLEAKLGQEYETLVAPTNGSERIEGGMLVGEDERGGLVRGWRIEVDRPAPGLTSIWVATQWTERGAPRSVLLVGFKARGE